MDIKVLLAALGLPEGATADQITEFAVSAEKNKTALGKLLAALGLSVGATEAAATAKVNQLNASDEANGKLLGALGAKSPDEAIGAVAALQANRDASDPEGHCRVMAALGANNVDEAMGAIGALNSAKERLAEAEAKLAELTAKQEQGERDEIVAKLEAEGKITPAQKEALLPSLSLAGLKKFASTAVPVLKGDGKKEPGGNKAYTGKTFKQLSAAEARQLHDDDPETFQRLVAESRQ